MKQMVVLGAMIVLGLFMYGLIAGTGENSILTGLGTAWEKNIDTRNAYPGEG